MKKIKIKFVDFWEHWNDYDNFIVDVLKKKYDVEISDKPDYVFFSTFNRFFDHMDYNSCVKIFYTQENLCPDFNFCDYGIGFENLEFKDRYIKYPIFLIKNRYGKAWDLMQEKHLENNILEKKSFCSFVVSNGNADPIREEMFKKLCEYKKVDSGGRYLNNIGQPNGVDDKLEFEKKHKFSICFENSSHEGYATEKLIEAFAAKTVPIYWGDPSITTIFNKDAFVFVNDFETVDDAVEFISKIDQDDEMYFKMLNTPALLDKDYGKNKQKEFEQFLFNIFEQEYSKAFRRNRVFWGHIYEERYEKMRNIYNLLAKNKILLSIKRIFKK